MKLHFNSYQDFLDFDDEIQDVLFDHKNSDEIWSFFSNGGTFQDRLMSELFRQNQTSFFTLEKVKKGVDIKAHYILEDVSGFYPTLYIRLLDYDVSVVGYKKKTFRTKYLCGMLSKEIVAELVTKIL